MLRMLALACLAIVLARPFLPQIILEYIIKISVVHAIIVDNSPSMSRIGPQGPLLEQAQTLALEMIDNGQDEIDLYPKHLWPALLNHLSESATARARVQK